MSIFNDTPLPEGTVFYENTVLKYCNETKRYLVTSVYGERWLSRKNVEDRHADFLLSGVETRVAQPGNGYNTRFFRRNPDRTNQ